MMGRRNSAIGKSLKPHDYNGWDNETKVCHFLQVIKITKLEAVTNVAHAQPEKDVKDFDATVNPWPDNQEGQPEIS